MQHALNHTAHWPDNWIVVMKIWIVHPQLHYMNAWLTQPKIKQEFYQAGFKKRNLMCAQLELSSY